MELWDVFTADREKTGRTAVRGEGLGAGEYHVVVHIWLVNDEGDLLIQRRAACVELAPNVWATTGGSALAGRIVLLRARGNCLRRRGLRPTCSTLSLRSP